jgi:Tol biopolymer transport system component
MGVLASLQACARGGRRNVLFVVLVGLASFLAALLVGDARSAQADTRLIAFTRGDGIYVMRADGSGVRRIMRAGPTSVGPMALYGEVAWSPDGRRLAFASWNGIWLMDANGQHQVRLIASSGQPYYIGAKPHRTLFYPQPTSFGSPTWSPDGRRIAFTAFQGIENRDIWIMNADGSNLQRLKKTPYFEGEVDWSPTGGWVAFDSGSWVSDLYVIRTNGAGLRNLTPGGGMVGSGHPAWSPDGRTIAFARPSGIWITDASGRAQLQLTTTKAKYEDGNPDWSPDGRKIAFVRMLEPRKLTSSEIYVMNADGTGLTRQTHNQIGEGSPAWQPRAVS